MFILDPWQPNILSFKFKFNIFLKRTTKYMVCSHYLDFYPDLNVVTFPFSFTQLHPHHMLAKRHRLPSGINKLYLITPCEISHFTSIALQPGIAGGLSGGVITYQSFPQQECFKCPSIILSLSLNLSLSLETQDCAFSDLRTCLQGDACLICWGRGIPSISPEDKATRARTKQSKSWGPNNKEITEGTENASHKKIMSPRHTYDNECFPQD